MTTIITSHGNSSRSPHLVVRPTLSASSSVDTPPPRRMPLVIPASELYYWSSKWQAQEREFEEDRAAGRLIEAASMDDVLRDLFSAED